MSQLQLSMRLLFRIVFQYNALEGIIRSLILRSISNYYPTNCKYLESSKTKYVELKSIIKISIFNLGLRRAVIPFKRTNVITNIMYGM